MLLIFLIFGIFSFLCILFSIHIYKKNGNSFEFLISLFLACGSTIISIGMLIPTGIVVSKYNIEKVNNEYIRNTFDGFEYYIYNKDKDIYEPNEIISNKGIKIVIDREIEDTYLEITRNTHLISFIDEIQDIKLYTNSNDVISNDTNGIIPD